MKIGFSLQTSYALPMEQALPLLRQAGFDAISPVWQADSQMETIANTAAKCGLTLQSLHGQLRGIPYMWSREGEARDKIIHELMAGLSPSCSAFQPKYYTIYPGFLSIISHKYESLRLKNPTRERVGFLII